LDLNGNSLNDFDIKNQLSNIQSALGLQTLNGEKALLETDPNSPEKLFAVFKSLHVSAQEIFWAIKPAGSTAAELKKPATKFDYSTIHKYLKALRELQLVRRDESNTKHVFFRAVEFPPALLASMSAAEIAPEHCSDFEQNELSSNPVANSPVRPSTANHEIEAKTMDTSTSSQQTSNVNSASNPIFEKMRACVALYEQINQIEQDVEVLGGEQALELLKVYEMGIMRRRLDRPKS
jgi:Fe2+ or Zn2+ uptake regulation protein